MSEFKLFTTFLFSDIVENKELCVYRPADSDNHKTLMDIRAGHWSLEQTQGEIERSV